jgi:hypothetical protein
VSNEGWERRQVDDSARGVLFPSICSSRLRVSLVFASCRASSFYGSRLLLCFIRYITVQSSFHWFYVLEEMGLGRRHSRGGERTDEGYVSELQERKHLPNFEVCR